MSTVIMQAVVSVDGYIAYDDDLPGHLFDWYGNGDVELLPGLRVSQASADYVRPFWEDIGVIVMGRHLFDFVNGWEGRPPTGEHVVVVSHRPKPEGWHPEAKYHFVDSVEKGIAKAKELAGERLVCVTAGKVAAQALAAGLVDEIAMDVAPVVLGTGKRFFGDYAGTMLLSDPVQVVQGNRVLHVRYRVEGPAEPSATD
ncbi:MAG TPA: dihydrofolate reductase family protein [Jatrophihabitans sp.]|jgi:dihydrofolate reductase|uniref:dihydrofolate reductase family protein n=1 Tax=Jatrophihabitans sp. TaxID=1932789 RepID=UPI002EF8C95B